MVNDYRIKEVTIAGVAPGSLAGGSAFNVGSTSETINGEVLSVAFKSNNIGSLFLTGSNAIGREVYWSALAMSGTAYQVAYPTVVTVDNTNTSLPAGSGLTVTNRVVNGFLYLGGSGPNGGSVSNFTIRYR